jgi:hypothetical protein
MPSDQLFYRSGGCPIRTQIQFWVHEVAGSSPASPTYVIYHDIEDTANLRQGRGVFFGGPAAVTIAAAPCAFISKRVYQRAAARLWVYDGTSRPDVREQV